MHPDQKTPESHRYRSPDSKPSPREHAPEQEQTLPPEAERDQTTVRTPEPEGQRLGEAGNTYTGRQMDDDLKAHPRVEDADRVQAEDADEA